MKSRAWLDGEFGLGLYCRDLLCAVAGFNIAYEDTINYKTRQDKTRQDKTRQDKTRILEMKKT